MSLISRLLLESEHSEKKSNFGQAYPVLLFYNCVCCYLSVSSQTTLGLYLIEKCTDMPVC